MRFKTVRVSVVGAAAILALGLTGCSGGTDDAGATPEAPASSTPSAATPSASTPASSAPESSDSPSADADSSSDSGSDSGSGESSGKPSKSEVQAGLVKMYKDKFGIDGPASKLAAKCLTSELYDTASDELLQAVASGDPTSALGTMDGDDRQTFTTAASNCTKKITNGNN